MNCLIENARNIINCFQDSPKLYYAVSINTDEFPDTNGCRFYDIGDEGLFYFEVSCLHSGRILGVGDASISFTVYSTCGTS